jgi:hypothetical protein
MARTLFLLNNMGCKKAYVHIDFAFALTFFFIFFYTVYVLQSNALYAIKDESKIIELSAQARDICYLISENSGLPSNWEDTPYADVLGFKNSSSSYLSVEKLNAVSGLNYFDILSSFGMYNHFYISATDMKTGVDYFDLGAKGNLNSLRSSYSCFGNTQFSKVQFYVEVWS